MYIVLINDTDEESTRLYGPYSTYEAAKEAIANHADIHEAAYVLGPVSGILIDPA